MCIYMYTYIGNNQWTILFKGLRNVIPEILA